MNKKLLLESALLASAFMLNIPAATAIAVIPPPYTSSAHADAQGFVDDDGPNPGPSSAIAIGPVTTSIASANGFELHSYSQAYDNYYMVELNSPVNDDLYGPGVSTSGRASFTQQFQVIGAGSATLRFDWDGTLYSDGSYTAGYAFSAYAGNLMRTLGEVGNRQKIDGGTATIDLFDTINLFFNPEDIGKTFEVNAELSTFVNGDDRIMKTILFEQFADVASPYTLEGPLKPSAYANFSDTALFSFTGQGVITPSAVPVPAAIWLLGSALLGLFGVKRAKTAA